MITMLASIGLPMLSNFIGEYLVLQGTSLVYFRWTVFAALGVILSACYMLWLYQRVFFGKASEDLTHHMPDLDFREYAIIVPLILLMVWMGTLHAEFPSARFPHPTPCCWAQLTRSREIHVRRLRRRSHACARSPGGARQCPLTSCRRASTTSASCPKSS